MASAEQLLNEAQYAFQSITAGDSRENRRNAARAKSLCQKIFRKYPGTTEAVVAHGIMMRLGEEVPMPRVHESHQADGAVTVTEVTSQGPDDTVAFDWSGLLAVVLGSSKVVLGVIAFAGLILFGFLGPLLFLPLLAFAFLTSPLRQSMKPDQRRQVNEFVIQANAWIRERRRAGRGLV
ncbi:MAG: hypothetical protein P8X81_08260 [Woeseiaceae bacterium]|jgi:hypothetical protein